MKPLRVFFASILLLFTSNAFSATYYHYQEVWSDNWITYGEPSLLSFDGFDRSLGTLTGATLTLEGYFSSELDGTFIPDQEFAGYEPTMTSNSPSNLSTSVHFGSTVIDDVLTVNHSLSGACHSPDALGPCSIYASDMTNIQLALDLTGYVNAFNGDLSFDENISIDFDIFTNLSLYCDDPLGVGDCLSHVTSVINLSNASVDYDYQVSSVPVPAAAWLFGSGLLGLVGVARRKNTV